MVGAGRGVVQVLGILSHREVCPHVRALSDTAGPQFPHREDPTGRKSPLEGRGLGGPMALGPWAGMERSGQSELCTGGRAKCWGPEAPCGDAGRCRQCLCVWTSGSPAWGWVV